MKRIYWILTSISLYSLLSCSNGAKDTREYQTVKTDTVVSAGGRRQGPALKPAGKPACNIPEK